LAKADQGELAGGVGAPARSGQSNSKADEIDDGAFGSKALNESLHGDEAAFDVGFLSQRHWSDVNKEDESTMILKSSYIIAPPRRCLNVPNEAL
jgi:hypothetical protein